MSNLPTDAKPPREVFLAARRRRESQLRGQASADTMARVEAALRDVSDSPRMDHAMDHAEAIERNEHHDERPDPAPTVPAIAEERAQQLVTNISSQMLGELRALRDQIDDLMRDMNERRDLIREAIRAHAEFAESSIQHKIIIAESVAKLRAEFELSRTPLPPIRNV